ncbi:DNA-processing protein DprA [Fluviispira sanaruensis]|uniref:DNA-processing protein DprA n=1 Tax=Fluviispira sanaruensis TaxID=2493639 RepID=A0A4P2VQN6_FLUSA|nr:DNA-processing protein DprA [Fluviispira sanaruensis]BBH54750.1 DNA-processing protein DprA [Fluviispira sanaruensis]
MENSIFENLQSCAISPSLEIGSYEALWDQSEKMGFAKLAKMFASGAMFPSHFIATEVAEKYYAEVMKRVQNANLNQFGVRIRGTLDYKPSFLEACEPLEVIYYEGLWDLVYTPSVAIVGTRHPSEEGIRRAKKLTQGLIEKGYTIVSGLAAGIDTAAHSTALEYGGKTIAVIGTPLSEVYPKENKDLFARIAKDHLIISQVPFIKYEKQNIKTKRLYFPERNKTMSALTKATVIVEAGETSGTLVQARAALKQKRKLFILQNNFDNPRLTWPKRMEEKGAIRVKDFNDLWVHLEY